MRHILISLLTMSLSFFSLAQIGDPYVKKFNEIINSKSQINNLRRMEELSKRGNSVDFMHLSYCISALNNMFIATSDQQYLEINEILLNNVFKNSKVVDGRSTWNATSKLERFANVSNKEVILYEGYLSKYLAEYVYLSKKSKMSQNRPLLTELENLFMKWYNRSIAEYGDASSLYGIRTHIGAQWATTALYLLEVSPSTKNKEVYRSFVDKYSMMLRKNLLNVSSNGSSYYLWNSTWDTPFTSLQLSRRKVNKDKNEIQDVSHGNHVVQFIVASYELGYDGWRIEDINRLANTFKMRIYSNNNSFSDNIDGTRNKEKSMRETGWKVSDGWMRLIKYDKAILNELKAYYSAEKTKLDHTYLNLQFISNLAITQ